MVLRSVAVPMHTVELSSFRIDVTPVTNIAYSRFAEATGYVTLAERKPDVRDFPGVPTAPIVPGSAVFRPPAKLDTLDDAQWTSDWYRPDTYAKDSARGVLRDPKGPERSHDPTEPGTMKRVQRGGSFLCSDRYCTRYLVGSRGKSAIDSAGSNVGFRCAKSTDAAMGGD